MTITPNTILLFVNFSKYSSRRGRNIPNDTRRCLMGENTSESTNLPKLLNSALGKEVVFPSLFSLIKKPATIQQPGGRKPKIDNTARGAMATYRYVGPADDLKATCEALREVCRRIGEKEHLGWADYEVMVAGKM